MTVKPQHIFFHEQMGWKDAGGLDEVQDVCPNKQIQMVLEERGLWLCSSRVLRFRELEPLPSSLLSLHPLQSHSLKGQGVWPHFLSSSSSSSSSPSVPCKVPQMVLLVGSSGLHTFPWTNPAPRKGIQNALGSGHPLMDLNHSFRSSGI